MSLPNRTLLIVIAAAAALAIAATLLPYFVHFHGPLAADAADWASFGSYVGGVTAPLLAFASLIAVLYTVHIQWAEIRRSAQIAVHSAELQRLAGLIALHDHYQKHIEHQGRLAELLQGTSGQQLAYTRIAALDAKLREVVVEIERFHARCVEATDA